MRLLWLCILVETCHFGYSTRSNCKQCDFAVELLHSAWEEKTTSTCIGDLAEFICTTFNIEDHFVCKGIAGEFKDEFTYVLSVIIIEPHQICGLLMKDCGTFIDPLSVSWNITIPSNQPSPIDKKTVSPGKPILRVLHLTDLHLDMLYTPGLEAKCKEPQCCRPQQNPNELGKSKVSQMAGPWGTVGNCDVPYWLLINMLEFVRKNHRDLDYILVTGDITSHADWDYTPTSHVAMIKNISETLKSYFPNIPVYFSVGNHEGVPIDNFAPHFTPDRFHIDWLYESMAKSWEGWVPNEQMETVKYMGCYMKKIYPGLRLISINNALGGDALNFFLYINQTDPDGTLTWLIKQLSKAEKEGDVVHILAHIPGGDGEALEGWAINYYKVVNRFQNIIVGQFFGHTHSEEFYITYDDPEDSSSRPTSVVYSAPSLTTYSEFFPAYRIYDIDGVYAGSTYQVIDFEEWYFNITEADSNPSNPMWKQLYASVNQEYDLKSQVPSEWNNMIERMKTDDALFEKYRKNYYRRSKYDGVGSCDSNCRKGWMCNARKMHHSQKLCADLGGEQAKRSTYRKSIKPVFRNKQEIMKFYAKWRTTRANDKCPI